MNIRVSVETSELTSEVQKCAQQVVEGWLARHSEELRKELAAKLAEVLVEGIGAEVEPEPEPPLFAQPVEPLPMPPYSYQKLEYGFGSASTRETPLLKTFSHAYRGFTVTVTEFGELFQATLDEPKLGVRGNSVYTVIESIERKIDEYLAEVPKPEPKPRLCQRCGKADISDRPAHTKYCHPCARRENIERAKTRKTRQGSRNCKDCGNDISDRHHAAKYCLPCAKVRERKGWVSAKRKVRAKKAEAEPKPVPTPPKPTRPKRGVGRPKRGAGDAVYGKRVLKAHYGGTSFVCPECNNKRIFKPLSSGRYACSKCMARIDVRSLSFLGQVDLSLEQWFGAMTVASFYGAEATPSLIAAKTSIPSLVASKALGLIRKNPELVASYLRSN